MKTILFDGVALAERIRTDLAEQIRALGSEPHLAAVCVGDDSGIRSFVKLKQKAAQAIGVQFSSYFFEADDEEGARTTLAYLATDDTVDGIFVELPLPESWDAKSFLSLIPESKDVDVLSHSAEDSYRRGSSLVLPPAVGALQYVVRAGSVDVRSMRVAVVGQGSLVGAPVAQWLERQGALVDRIDIATKEPEAIARNADIVVAGVGVPGLINDAWIKEGALVIDFGFGLKNGKHWGDVDSASIQNKAGILTPVPGGMGPLVITAVLENVLTLAMR